MGTMSNLYTGISGLRTSQEALNVTANNLANVNTKGYVRQQVYQGDRESVWIGLSAMNQSQVGLGVTIGEVRQVRNSFLDKYYRQEAGREAFYDECYQAAVEVQDFLGEMQGAEFQTALSDFWETVHELAKAPEMTVNQNMFIEYAGILMDRAKSVYKGMREYQSTINYKITDTIDRINEIGEQVSEMNQQILKIESNDVEKAKDIRDQRAVLLDELGSYVKMDYKELPNGTVRVSVEGNSFITTNRYNKMGYTQDPDTGFVTPVWPAYGNEPIYDLNDDISTAANSDIGSLKAMVLSRGKEYANYTVFYESDLKTMISSEDYVNSVANSVMESTEAEFDNLIHIVITKINDVLCPNKLLTDADGNAVLDENGKEIYVWDAEKGSYGSDEEATPATELFSRNGIERYTEKTITVDGVEKKYFVFNQENADDPKSLYSIANVKVNSKLEQIPSLLPTMTNTGDTNYEMAKALADAWQNMSLYMNPNSDTMCNVTGYYNQMVLELSVLGSVYQEISESLSGTVATIETQRQGVIGVSSDEELTNMIKYQNAYNASSRYINAVSEMIEHLLNKLG